MVMLLLTRTIRSWYLSSDFCSKMGCMCICIYIYMCVCVPSKSLPLKQNAWYKNIIILWFIDGNRNQLSSWYPPVVVPYLKFVSCLDTKTTWNISMCVCVCFFQSWYSMNSIQLFVAKKHISTVQGESKLKYKTIHITIQVESVLKCWTVKFIYHHMSPSIKPRNHPLAIGILSWDDGFYSWEYLYDFQLNLSSKPLKPPLLQPGDAEAEGGPAVRLVVPARSLLLLKGAARRWDHNQHSNKKCESPGHEWRSK